MAKKRSQANELEVLQLRSIFLTMRCLKAVVLSKTASSLRPDETLMQDIDQFCDDLRIILEGK